MTFVRKLAGMGIALAAAALLFGAFSATAHAQNPPMTVYGTDAPAGAEVEAFIDGVSCGTATADAQGQWQIQIAADAACAPAPGDTITFTLDGAPTDATETFQFGGAPANVAQGVSLQVTGTPTVPPAETGNAGLVGGAQGGVSGMLLVLGLVAAAAVVAGGARAMTRSSR